MITDRDITLQAWRKGEFPSIFQRSVHERSRYFSPLYRPPLPSWYFRLSRPQSHSANVRIKWTKNPNDTIGNRTGDLPNCSAVPQPTAPTRTPKWSITEMDFALWQTEIGVENEDYVFQQIGKIFVILYYKVNRRRSYTNVQRRTVNKQGIHGTE
jgi:hypothetical protein